MCHVLSLIRVKSFYKDTFDKQSFLMCHSDSFLLTFTSALLLTAFRFHSIKGVQSSLRVECFPPTHLSLSHTHTHTHTHTHLHLHTNTHTHTHTSCQQPGRREQQQKRSEERSVGKEWRSQW